MRICFDLDNTLCTGKPYETAEPYSGIKEMLLRLKEAGHTIIIYTARGMGTSSSNTGAAIANIGKLTLDQLESWDFVYDEIYFGKPNAELYIDDKAYHASSIKKLESFIKRMENSNKQVGTYCSKIQSMISRIDKCTKE